MTHADRGYLVVQGDPRDEQAQAFRAKLHSALNAARWSAAVSIDGLEVFVGPASPLKPVIVHRRHVLIGRWRGRGTALSSLIGQSRSALEIARRAVASGHGTYLLAWRTDGGALALLRDPSGALDCLTWRREGLRFACDGLPIALDGYLPTELAIDWETLGEIAEAPGLLTERPALRGLATVTPGDLVLMESETTSHRVWRPSDAFRFGVWDESADGLRNAVDTAVAAAAEPHRHLVGEISGGLDSAIVATALAEAGAVGKTSFINYHGDWVEGDERPYAEAVADRIHAPLSLGHKPVEPIEPDQLAPLAWGFRPGLHGVDVAYDRDCSERMNRSGATGLITGQGGDAVFFQAPDPRIVVDRRRREGLRALDPRYLADVGRWTRHSAWTLAGMALSSGSPVASNARRHAWTVDADDLPPAKRSQVLRLANCQLFWSDCRRAQAGELIHPLLSQPVIEHLMAIPADKLLRGVRDRGLARAAFSDRLPAAVVERRDKGDLSQFYGRVVVASLPSLRPYLLDGLLAEHRLIDRVQLERDLTPARLAWSAASNQPLLWAVLEAWARAWSDRISARRRAEMA